MEARNMDLLEITSFLNQKLAGLAFGPPAAYVYNPLEYARANWELYLKRYARPGVPAILLGMNPGPWGMAQTGVPFGEVQAVRGWLGIDQPVGKPAREHPQRPVLGLACPRREVSGRRVWDWAAARFHTPEAFFERFFVANYCPLCFMEESGRNLTPDKLPSAERAPLLAICDEALRQTVAALRPRIVLGFGNFAAARAKAALAGFDCRTGSVPHPSPASPRANKNWAGLFEQALGEHGLL